MTCDPSPTSLTGRSSQIDRTKSPGFTLLELMCVIAIIGILAAIALPSYQRYMNEANAAKFVVRAHEIAMAYQDLLATGEILPHEQSLSSPAFGKPPAHFPGLASVFTPTDGITLSVQLVNHSGYFHYTGHEPFPVLFLQAQNSQGEGILRALDHITSQKHGFVTPSMMMIALAQPHEVHTQNPTGGYPLSSNPHQEPDVPAQPPTIMPPAEAVNTAPSGGSGSATDTQTLGSTVDTPPTSTGEADGASHTQGTVNNPTTDSSGTHLNWPPGWVMHPDKHTGQQHGNH